MEAKLTTKTEIVPVAHSLQMHFGSRYKVLASLRDARAYMRAWGWRERWGVYAWLLIALSGVCPGGVRCCLWRLKEWGFVGSRPADLGTYYSQRPRGAGFLEYDIARRGSRYLRQVAKIYPESKALWDAELAGWRDTLLDGLPELATGLLDTDKLTEFMALKGHIPLGDETRTVVVTVTDKPARASKTAPAPEYTQADLQKSIDNYKTPRDEIARNRRRRFGWGEHSTAELQDFIERLKVWWADKGVDIAELALLDRLALERHYQQSLNKPLPGPKQQSVPKKPGYWR
jgi:hypothetical protein